MQQKNQALRKNSDALQFAAQCLCFYKTRINARPAGVYAGAEEKMHMDNTETHLSCLVRCDIGEDLKQ